MMGQGLRAFEINRWESLRPKFDENAEGFEAVGGVKLGQELSFRVIYRLRGRTIATSGKCDVRLGGSLISGVVFMMSP